VIRRFRGAGKAPLAVAGILSTPLFFVALMAMSLAVEKPVLHHVVRKGKTVLRYADPSGSIEAKIWLLALIPALALLVIGTASILLGRLGVLVTAVAAILFAVGLMAPLGTWVDRHDKRFPVGVDLIPASAGSQDIYLRGEWEHDAKRTATQLAVATIVIAGASILALGLSEVRKRRGAAYDIPPPPADAMVGPPHSVEL
jgi:hypothetical protein